MVPFVDVAFGVFLRSLFPQNYTICYAPPALSRQALARVGQEKRDPNVGIPGLTVYRTACYKNKQASSIPQAFDGFNAGLGPLPAQNLTFSGTVTANDTVKVAFASKTLFSTSSPVVIQHTCLDTDQLQDIVTDLAQKINANSTLTAQGITATANADVLFVVYPAAVVISATVGGAQTEMVQITQAIPATFNSAKFLRVIAEYTVQAWTRDPSDRDEMERILWFSEIYKEVAYQLEGPGFSIQNHFAFEGEDPNYQEIPDDKTGQVVWYGFDKKFRIMTQWLQTGSIPEIASIQTQFKSYYQGEPLGPEITDVWTIYPK